MNTRTTVVLLVVLIVLGGYVYWSGQGAPTSSATPSTSEAPVVQVNAADVSAVVIDGNGGKQVRAERSGNDWKLTAPNAASADAGRVNTLLNDIATLKATRVITPTNSDLAPYGLSTPTYKVELLKGTTPLTTLKVGSKNPDGSGVYLQRDGAATVYLVSSSILGSAENWLSDPPIKPTPAPTTPPLTVVPATPTK